MRHVFVSYSRRDATRWALQIAEHLAARKVPYWLDQKDIPISVPFMDEISDAIDEASFVLVCESPESVRSWYCQFEVDRAAKAHKPTLVAKIGMPPESVAAEVTLRVNSLSPNLAVRTDLRVAARDWDRAGRPGRMLAGRVQQGRFNAVRNLPPAMSEPEESYLRASRSRTRRRSLTAAGIAVVTMLGCCAGGLYTAAREYLERRNDAAATAYLNTRSYLDTINLDPYGGLSIAAQLGDDESAIDALVISEALAGRVPDDAFNVPAGATRFALPEVAEDVVVTDDAGAFWGRGASAADIRSAVVVDPPAEGPSTPREHGLAASVVGDTGMVYVLKDDHLLRAVTFPAAPGRMAFSPNGRFLAAVVDAEVVVADVRTGQSRMRLRGAPDAPQDLTWSSDSQRVWALAGRRVVSWSTGSARSLLDDTSANFNSVLRADDPATVWVAGVDELTRVDANTGAVLARRQVDDVILSAGGSPDGTVAVVSGEKRVWIVPLTTDDTPQSLEVPKCSYGRPFVSNDKSAVLPCIGGELVTLDLATASETGRRSIPNGGAFAVQGMPDHDTLLVGEFGSRIFAVDADRVRQVFQNQCGAEMGRIAVSPDGHAVVGVGDGSGTCTFIGRLSGEDASDPAGWTWNAWLPPSLSSVVGSSAVFDPTSAVFAIGFSDGTVFVAPTQNILPWVMVTLTSGSVRQMLALPDGGVVLVTDTGMVQRFELCGECVSNAALAREAAEILDRSLELGLAERVS